MKQTLFFILSAIITLSCDKLTPTIKFTHELSEIMIDIPANTITTGNQVFADQTIASDIKPTLEANGVSADQIKSIKVESTIFTLTSGNFDFANSIETYLSMGGSTTLFAFKNPIPAGVSTLELDLDKEADLASYLKATSYNLILKGQKKAPNNATTIKVKIKFTIEATAKK